MYVLGKAVMGAHRECMHCNDACIPVINADETRRKSANPG